MCSSSSLQTSLYDVMMVMYSWHWQRLAFYLSLLFSSLPMVIKGYKNFYSNFPIFYCWCQHLVEDTIKWIFTIQQVFLDLWIEKTSKSATAGSLRVVLHTIALIVNMVLFLSWPGLNNVCGSQLVILWQCWSVWVRTCLREWELSSVGSNMLQSSNTTYRYSSQPSPRIRTISLQIDLSFSTSSLAAWSFCFSCCQELYLSSRHWKPK